ncbi:MAG: GspH/FimT family pseudopilin [Candidatus Competibacteraceae bacterium]|nr:GspH/FimT family pseudopilin [Candidatus Competibacteraceae bacterium]
MLTQLKNLGKVKRYCAGFTLLELVVTIALFGLLISLGLPAYTEMIQNTKIRNAAESIHAGIQLARVEALKRNVNVTFWMVSLANPKVMDNSCALSGTSSSWVVSVDDPSSNCGTAPSNATAPRIVQSHTAGDGNSNVVVESENDRNHVTFNGLGQVVASNEPLTKLDVKAQTSGDFRSLRIHISPMGSTRMCDPKVLASDDPRKC